MTDYPRGEMRDPLREEKERAIRRELREEVARNNEMRGEMRVPQTFEGEELEIRSSFWDLLRLAIPGGIVGGIFGGALGWGISAVVCG